MRDKIAATVVQGLLLNKTGNEIADAILDLKVKIEYKLYCQEMPERWIITECKLEDCKYYNPSGVNLDCRIKRPATIKDLIGD